MFLSIVTATYNRAYRLPRLYESLCAQTDHDFEWVVVDDGSVDETKALIDLWIQEGKLDIRYFYKENGGFHTAMNLGISEAIGTFVLKMDSDDFLLENAVERIRHYSLSDLWVSGDGKRNRELCGICFLDVDISGNVIGDKFKRDYFIGDYISDRINAGIKGDKSEVGLTKKLKEVPHIVMPEGKSNMGSNCVWIPLAKKYDMLFVNESFYVADYADDGLTKSVKNERDRHYSLGKMYGSRFYLTNEFKLSIRMKHAYHYISGGLRAKVKLRELISTSNAPVFVSLNLPLMLPLRFLRYMLKIAKKHN